MLNERLAQFYDTVYCKVTRQLRENPKMGLKNIDDLALKQNMNR